MRTAVGKEGEVEGMTCIWSACGFPLGEYAVYVLVGRPGQGKTTAALHIVAHDLLRRGVVNSYADALREAGRRLFLGRSLKELFEFIRDAASNPSADWVIVDDAAIGFHDVADRITWSRLMDIIKTARLAVANCGLIFTTTAVQYLSKRVLHTARVYYVKRTELSVETFTRPNGYCDFHQSKAVPPAEYTILLETVFTLEGEVVPGRWRGVKPIGRWRPVMLIPWSPDFAMPQDVEREHVEARRERVRAAAEEALRRIARREEDEELGVAKRAKIKKTRR